MKTAPLPPLPYHHLAPSADCRNPSSCLWESLFSTRPVIFVSKSPWLLAGCVVPESCAYSPSPPTDYPLVFLLPAVLAHVLETHLLISVPALDDTFIHQILTEKLLCAKSEDRCWRAQRQDSHCVWPLDERTAAKYLQHNVVNAKHEI